MTTTTHFTALLAGDRQRRYLADAAAYRLARGARSERAANRRRPRPQVVLSPANTLQPNCA